MTYYYQEVLRLRRDLFPKDYLVRQVMQAKLHIDQHYASPMPLKTIAAEAYISKFHFARLFKAYYGRTPHQYLTEVRITQAKRLLEHNATASEACYAVGFESVTSFTALFKKATGRTPAAYRAGRQQQITLKQS
jgi:AraC-like DNA-binding protein